MRALLLIGRIEVELSLEDVGLAAEADGGAGSGQDVGHAPALGVVVDAGDLNGVEEVVLDDLGDRVRDRLLPAQGEGVGHEMDDPDLHVVVQ